MLDREDKKTDLADWVVARSPAGAFIGRIISGRSFTGPATNPIPTYDEEIVLDPAYEWVSSSDGPGRVSQAALPIEFTQSLKRVTVKPVVVFSLAKLEDVDSNRIDGILKQAEEIRAALRPATRRQIARPRIITPP